MITFTTSTSAHEHFSHFSLCIFTKLLTYCFCVTSFLWFTSLYGPLESLFTFTLKLHLCLFASEPRARFQAEHICFLFRGSAAESRCAVTLLKKV